MTEPKRAGRPAVAPDQRASERIEVRVTAQEREKFEALGGAKWLREALKRAKLKPEPAARN